MKYTWILAEETPIEALRRLSSWSNYETESYYYYDLKTLTAVFDFWQVLDDYDVSLLDEVIQSIEEGIDTAKKYNAFISKHKLPWNKL